MKRLLRWFCVVLLSVLFTTLLGSMEAGAQEKYPARGIDIICPFAAGGSTDLIARITAAFLS